jgi:GNAT superfamily N-acetyltransferase
MPRASPPEVSAAFDPTAFAKAWRASLESPREGVHRLLVALAGAQVVGIAAYGPSQDRDTGQATGEITLLGVHPLARRQGHGSRLLNACVDQLRDLGAEDVTLWLPADLEEMRSFLLASGIGPDGAYRDRIVSPDGAVLREVRLQATLNSTPDDAAEERGNDG